MKTSQELTDWIAKEFSVSSSDEIKLRTKLHELKETLIKEFSQKLKEKQCCEPKIVGFAYLNSEDLANITSKQADDYDNQSEEKRQRG